MITIRFQFEERAGIVSPIVRFLPDARTTALEAARALECADAMFKGLNAADYPNLAVKSAVESLYHSSVALVAQLRADEALARVEKGGAE